MNPTLNQRVSSSSSSKLPEIKRLFRTTVTSSDRHVISQFLLDSEKEMKGYDAEINRLKTAMHVLKKKKKGLKTTMDKCRSLLAPVHRLPLEILSLVFSFACRPSILDPSTITPGIQLSWVCGRWREVIIGTPSLWADLKITFPDWEDRFLILERLVHIFMDRSKSHPLRLRLTFDELGKFTEHASTALHLLFQNQKRWQNVCLSSLPNNLALSNEGDGDGTFVFPLLQALELGPVSELSPALGSHFKSTPALHTLTLYDDALLTSELRIPWCQIRTLQIGLSLAPKSLRFLTLFPHLASLELDQVGGEISNYNDHVLSSTLQSLKVTLCSQDDLDTTLPYLTLPEISSLQMCHVHENDAQRSLLDTTPLSDFLTRSGCSITSLSLVDLPVKDDQIIALLDFMPTIATLELEVAEDFGFITSKFLQRFVVAHEGFSSRPSFLPLLTHLALRLWEKDLKENDLFDVVASRWTTEDSMQGAGSGVVCLRSVSLALFATEDEIRMSSLQCFRDAGFRLRMNYYYN